MTTEALRANRPQDLDRIEVAAESGVVPLCVLPCEVLEASGREGRNGVFTTCGHLRYGGSAASASVSVRLRP